MKDLLIDKNNWLARNSTENFNRLKLVYQYLQGGIAGKFSYFYFLISKVFIISKIFIISKTICI